MKITKRQMHQIVKEAIRGTIHGDPNKEAFLDITMNAISKADYEKAAQAIMDSYFIDDVWDEEIEALVSMLASSRTGSTAPATTMEIEAIADDWMDGHRAGKWTPENIQEGNKVKITKRQLRRVIKEAIDIVNSETGELITFGDDPRDAAPDAAVPDLAKRLGLDLSPSGGALSNEDWEKLEDETVGKQIDRAGKKARHDAYAEEERLNIDTLLTRLQDWAHDAFGEYAADNPGTDMQDVAFDLADAAEYEFESDEWEELLWHFDGSLDDLKVYAAESMG